MEKLLERSIRTDIQIQEYNKAVEKALATISTHNAELEGLKTSLVSVVEELKEKVENQTQLLNQVIQNVTALQEKILIPTVQFNARGIRDKSPSDKQVIIFPTVIENMGNAYNAGTGVFQAPVNGTFLFNIQVCTYSGQWGRFYLVVDSGDNKITAISYYEASASASGTSNSVAQYLMEGQRVWAQSYSEAGTTNTIYHADTGCWSQFSGVLVNYKRDRTATVDGIQSWNWERDCTIYAGKTKVLISCAFTEQLICSFVCAFAETGFLMT